MNPNFWGPPAWTFLHSITFNYPENPTQDDKDNILNYFNSLGKVLPCESCQQNYKKHLIKLPLTDKVMSSRTNLSKWLVDIHNEVNKLTNKQIISYKDVVVKYRNSIQVETRAYYIKCLIILVVLVLLILLYVKYKSK